MNMKLATSKILISKIKYKGTGTILWYKHFSTTSVAENEDFHARRRFVTNCFRLLQ